MGHTTLALHDDPYPRADTLVDEFYDMLAVALCDAPVDGLVMAVPPLLSSRARESR